MAIYGLHADVAARLPRGAPGGGVFSATSRPTDTQVTTWLTEVSARIEGKIRAAGYDPSTVSAGGLLILTEAVTEYVAGLVERYWAGEDSWAESASERKRILADLIERLVREPDDVALELGITALATASIEGTSLASFHTDSDESVVPDRTFKVSGKF